MAGAAIISAAVLSAAYLAAMVGAAFASAAPTTAGGSESRCETAGKTVRANAVARVFTTRRGNVRSYHGCSRDTGRVHRLIRIPSGSEFLEHPRLTGRYFAAEYWHIDFHESVIIVWSVRRQRELWAGVTGEDYFATDVEVTRRGAVAWVGGGVHKCDRNGRAEIGLTDDGKLTRTGRTVYWRHRGKQRSYVLRGRASERAC